MKKLILTIIAAVAILCTAIAGHSTNISYGQLPAQAQEFIKTHFNHSGNNNPTHCIKTDNGYQVMFSNGAKVCFDNNGKWEQIKCASGKDIPLAAVPTQLKEFMSKNHPNQEIVGIERNNEGYKVYLNNKTSLQFDKLMHFVKQS